MSNCNKIGYSSRREAVHVLKLINQRRGRGDLRVYRCHFYGCDLWHHGRKPKSRRG